MCVTHPKLQMIVHNVDASQQKTHSILQYHLRLPNISLLANTFYFIIVSYRRRTSKTIVSFPFWPSRFTLLFHWQLNTKAEYLIVLL